MPEIVTSVRSDGGQVNGDTAEIGGIEPDTIAKAYVFDWKDGDDSVLATLGTTNAVVSSNFAEDHDIGVGDVLTIRSTADRTADVTVVGTFEPPPFYPLLESVNVSTELFDSLYDRPRNRWTWANVAGEPTDESRAQMEAALAGYPDTQLETREEWIDREDADFNEFITFLYVMLTLAVFVSIFGMINTLVLSVYERTREIGMLRAIGMTRRQVRRMIRQESVITALIGAALGLPLGIFLAALVNRALERVRRALLDPVGAADRAHDRRDRHRDPRRDHARAARGEAESARSDRVRVAWRVSRFAIKGLLSRKLRTALTAIAIVLGVAMISGTYVLTDSIDQAFDTIFTDIRKGSNAVITGKSAFDLGDRSGVTAPTFDESLLAEVRALPGVAAGRGKRRLGRDAAHRRRRQGGRRPAARRTSASRSRTATRSSTRSTLVDGAWPGPDEVVVDKETAARAGLRGRARRSAFRRRARSRRLRVSGIVAVQLRPHDRRRDARRLRPPDGAAPLQEGRASSTRSPSRRSPTCPTPSSSSEIEAILPPDDAGEDRSSEQAQADAADTNEFISFLRAFLLAFGGIALFVGSFVIANSLSITIAQRTREFATLRTIGATNRQVLGSVIVEALVVGVVASIVGLFLGLLLAKGLFQLFDAVGFTLPNSGLVFEPRTVVVALAAGILVTLLASVYPGFRATMVPPIAAVREGAILPGEPLDRIRSTLAGVARDRVRRHRRRLRDLDDARQHARQRPARRARPHPHPLRLRALPVADARGARVVRARVRGARLRAVRAGPRHDERAALDGRRRAARLLRRRARHDAAHPELSAFMSPIARWSVFVAARPLLAVLHASVLASPLRRLGAGRPAG